MKLAITGAAGFLGREVARQALAEPGITSLVLADRDPAPVNDPRVAVMAGDLRDRALLARVCDADAVIHLAGILGGAAEADPALARAVNVDVPLDMIEAVKGTGVRFVFASSVAVLGAGLPEPVTDAAPARPTMLYGAQKAMIEVALEQATRRGWLDGVSLRPSGIVAREGLDEGLKSAFLSRLFWAVRRGEDICLPVGPEDRSWIASVGVTARNFLHAALTGDPGPTRTMTLPAQAPSFDELVAALQACYPESPARVTYAPEPETQRLFGRFPRLVTEAAEAAGFRRDADLAALVRDAMPQTTQETADEIRHPA